ncbi:MAG: hypothetical protein IKJ93_07465 [Clostridia bacterium]|nr:hypothetical protein [Clostridia bacterium]
MNYLDIHAHILPSVDDGAKDMETSIALLEMLKEQGVTHVVATPHFYPDSDSIEEFSETVKNAFCELEELAQKKQLPKIFLGCELRYFSGMGKSRAIKQFAVQNTDYLLLELPYGAPITKTVINDIIDIKEVLGLTPILAHIERYSKVPGFKKLLKLVSDNVAQAHINAGAVISKEDARLCEKLIKGGYVSYLASDTHSVVNRPPYIKQALDTISNKLGRSAATRLTIKSNRLLEEIEGTYEEYQFNG